MLAGCSRALRFIAQCWGCVVGTDLLNVWEFLLCAGDSAMDAAVVLFRPSGERSAVVLSWYDRPRAVYMAGDMGLACLPLCLAASTCTRPAIGFHLQVVELTPILSF